ncbi:MAG: hypothetical protein KDA97_12570, partial [Acidimicrobiales bacterium]|nr:hypothetical protein [Acidimicrobiales bacterium]
MIRTTLRTIWARKRRLASTATAVVLGVAFLAATLMLGDTLDASFDDVFAEANAGIDVVVRNPSSIDSDEGTLRADLDASVAEG